MSESMSPIAETAAKPKELEVIQEILDGNHARLARVTRNLEHALTRLGGEGFDKAEKQPDTPQLTGVSHTLKDMAKQTTGQINDIEDLVNKLEAYI